jgi:PAS domain S-box-containing protein
MHQNNQIHLQNFMDLSLDIVCVISIDGRFTNVSQACKKIWGYDPEELIGKEFINYVAKEDRSETQEIDSEIKKGKEVTHFENRYIHKNGDLVPIIWSAKFDTKKELIYCIAKDNSPIKKRESEKEKIIQSSQALINGTPNLIYSIDHQYKLLAYNQAMEEACAANLKLDIKVGHYMLDIPLLSERYMKNWKGLYDRCLSGEEIKVEMTPNDDKEIDHSPWISVNLTPIYENKKVVGLVCHSTDITKRKNAEIELKRQHDLVQNILKHIPMGVAVNEIDSGKQILLNKEFSKAYGWPESDLTDVATLFEKVYPKPDYRNEIWKRVTADMESGDMEKMQWTEIKVTTKEGKTKYIDAKNIPLIEQDLMISTVTDVTEKVLNKKEIKRALVEKQNILESISDSFYAVDRDLNFTFVNKSALKLLGKETLDELIGKHLFTEFPELEKTVFKDYLLEVIKSNKPARFEFYYEPYQAWFEENIYPSKEGFSFYFKDITKRKLISKALEEAYEKESEILDSISDAFLAVDRDFNFTYFNQKAEKLLQIKKEDAIGGNKWDLFSYAKGTIAEEEYNKALKNNETRTFDFYNEPLNKWFNIRSYPSKAGLSIYFRDISQEKQTQQKLEELNAELKQYTQKLEQSNKNLEQFAYIASHDLQEPLRMVSSFMTQLQKKYEDQLDDKAQTYINFAVDGTHRMRQIIVDLLEYSRAGTQKEELQKLDLNDEIAEVLSLFHSSISKKNIDLEIDELPVINYSRTAIRQLLHNLIGNAIKYSNVDKRPKIEVKVMEDKDKYQFKINDNGIGFDPKYKEKIFEIFQRLHSKSQYSGTGLGLAICKKIVEKYGGSIWVESQVGIGSTFYFTIPKNIKI